MQTRWSCNLYAQWQVAIETNEAEFWNCGACELPPLQCPKCSRGKLSLSLRRFKLLIPFLRWKQEQADLFHLLSNWRFTRRFLVVIKTIGETALFSEKDSSVFVTRLLFQDGPAVPTLRRRLSPENRCRLAAKPLTKVCNQSRLSHTSVARCWRTKVRFY